MLSNEKIKIISNSLEAFDFGRIQELYSMIVHLETFDFTIDEFKEWVNHRIKNLIVEEKELKEKYVDIICPECNEYMQVFSVNDGDREIIEGNYKSQLMCPDWENCGYEEFSEKSIEVWRQVFEEKNKSS